MMYPEQLREIGLLVGDAKAMELITSLVEKAYKDGYDDGYDDGLDHGYNSEIDDLREKIIDAVRALK